MICTTIHILKPPDSWYTLLYHHMQYTQKKSGALVPYNRKLSQTGGNTVWLRKFWRITCLCHQRMPHPQKTQIATKTSKFAKVSWRTCCNCVQPQLSILLQPYTCKHRVLTLSNQKRLKANLNQKHDTHGSAYLSKWSFTKFLKNFKTLQREGKKPCFSHEAYVFSRWLYDVNITCWGDSGLP